MDENRGRILAATRALMTGREAAFSIDAVAAEAGVARMTVYHQFQSKRGLLQALFDDLASRSLVGPLRASFDASDPAAALDGLIDAFTHFWAAERPILRRLRAAMVTDSDLDVEIRSRDERRRELLRGIVARFRIAGAAAGETVDLLHALTSFETFDALATTGRAPADVARAVRRLARPLVAGAMGTGD